MSDFLWRGSTSRVFQEEAKVPEEMNKFTRCKMDSSMSGAATFIILASIESIPCAREGFSFFRVCRNFVILTVFRKNVGVPLGLRDSHLLSLSTGSVLGLIAVCSLSFLTLL